MNRRGPSTTTRLVRVVLGVAASLAACADPRPLGADAAGLGVHAAGVLDPASPDFHGRDLAARGWDFALCATCHGADFAGTSAAPSCTSCHVRGPTACDTCHAEAPGSGAHATHRLAQVACTTCHQVPAAWDDDGHILVGGAVDPAPAEVVLTGLAGLTVSSSDRSGPPSYAPAEATCAQVYCHGAVLGPAGGALTVPRWTDDPPGPAGCTSCHGAPPPDHARADCATCHPTTPARADHLDGVVAVGDPALPACSGCHGGASSPAPPRDLAGATFTTAVGVGAHVAHLTGPRRLGPPVPCVTCHAEPATVTAAGHLDSAGPAEVASALGWDHDRATCASAWCHGPSQPGWTRTGEVTCGSCHGVPPATPAHAGVTTITACVTCHPTSVDPFGNVLVGSHLDGDVDAP